MQRESWGDITDHLTPKVALWPKGSLAKGPPSAPVGNLHFEKTLASAMREKSLEKAMVWYKKASHSEGIFMLPVL